MADRISKDSGLQGAYFYRISMDWLGFPVVKSYKGLDLSRLPINHAYVTANTTINTNVGVYSVPYDCFHCPYKLERVLRAGEPASWEIDVSRKVSWRILRTYMSDEISANTKRGLLCEMRPTFHEFGVYKLDVGRCEVRPEVLPVSTYTPFFLSILVLLAGLMIYKSINYMSKRLKSKHVEVRQEKDLNLNIDLDSWSEENYPALYVFRGILLAAIIFTTSGGGGYPVFNNRWAGISLAECLFFAYTWSVGVNIPNVIDDAFLKRNKWLMIRSVFVRAFLLTVLGFVIDSTVEYNRRHHGDMAVIWCPLQRLGVAYFLVASAYALTVQRYKMKSQGTFCEAVSNMVSLLWCWFISAFLLIIIVILTNTLISFNCMSIVPMDIEPVVGDMLKDDSENCNNGFTAYMNKLFVAEGDKVVNVNSYVAFSGGILGGMSTIMHTIIGLKAGVVYLNYKTHAKRLKLWTFWGTLFGLLGVLFGLLSIPIGFNLWPIASIHLLTTASLFAFMITYSVVEIRNVNNSTLCIFGLSSLPVFCGHLLFSHSVPFRWDINFQSHLLYLLQNYWIVALWFLISFLMRRKNVRFEI